MSYVINEDGSVTRNTPNPPKGPKWGKVICFVIAAIIVIAAAVIGVSKSQRSSAYQPSDDIMTADTVSADSAFNEPETVDSSYVTEEPEEEIQDLDSRKTKGGWRHSGTVITNYTETAGLTACKTKINKNNACKTGCIIGPNAGVVVIGKNSYACEGISTEIENALSTYRSGGTEINDIAITPNGKYVIIAGNNGYTCSTGITELEEELARANKDEETIYSVALTDNGKWVVITDKHYTSCGYFDDIKTAEKKYGTVYSVSMTDKGVTICCANGVYYKNVPKDIADYLDGLYWIPKYIKFTDGGTLLMTDGQSSYYYYM